MAIIQTCCCCGWTLRKGCYVSATFSLIYFFVFTWITGSMTVGRIQPYIFSPEIYESKSRVSGAYSDNFQTGSVQPEPQNQQHVIDRIPPVTSLPTKPSSSSTRRKEAGLENNITKRIPSISSNPDTQTTDEANGSVSILRVFIVSDAYSILQTVNLVLDLLCEVAGVYSSILLIRGLQQEKKSWFWPWMIVVPLHIAIDAVTMGGIMIEHFVEPMDTPLSIVLLTIFVDVTLNSINAYGLLCVISQYQEYKAGRGTAAYLEFTSQTPTIMLETASSTKTVLTKPNCLSQNNRRRSTKDYSTSRTLCNDKSDTCCEEYSMQNLSSANEKRCLTEGTCQNKDESGHQLKNGHTPKADGEDLSGNHNPCVYNNLNEVTWTENPNNNGKCVSESQKNQGNPVSTKFGKYLDVKNGKAGGRKRSNNQENENDEGCEVKFLNSKSAMLNNKCKLSWYNRKESETNNEKSESDSEDHTDDALSAFGIISYAKN